MEKQFKKYQHLERFGTTEVQNIELGLCYIFPKIDGTNGSLWMCPTYGLQAGSRNRHLTLDNDNAGFYNTVIKDERFERFFIQFPSLRLYGEWLVPHSLKTYRSESWRKFYVFDVLNDETNEYVHYEYYKEKLDSFGIDYIPPVSIIRNSNYEQLIEQLKKNVFLIEDGKGAGEGIVIKNYDYKNKFGRTTWAKIVTSEFKEKNAKEMGLGETKAKKMIEEDIVEKYLTKALADKVHAKIENECGWSSKNIPQLLHTIYYDLVKEETWNFIKEFKNPTINYGTLQHLAFQKTKQLKPELF